MSKASKSNPFTPGTGLYPPYLAGREKQQKLLKGMLDNITTGKPVSIAVMFGPRGMGKTALLLWLKHQCAKRKIRHIKESSATMLGSVEALTNGLLGKSRWFNERGASLGTKWLNIGVSAPNKASGTEAFLTKRLIARCRRKPLVVLLDEAHVPSNPDVLRLLLNTAQGVAHEAKFLLVLAGTPQLPETLKNAQSTFVERAETIGLGCLDAESAAAAINVPLEKDGITIAKDVLDKVVGDSQRYPFFIQLWGRALWNHAMEKTAGGLTQDDVNSVIEDIQTQRVEFYESRYEVIAKSPELLTSANALAKPLIDQQELDRTAATSIVQKGLTDTASNDDETREKAEEIINRLYRHDFFWRPPGSLSIVPGIPSFMNYVRNRPTFKIRRK